MEENIPSIENNAAVSLDTGAGDWKVKTFSSQNKEKAKKLVRQAKSWWLFLAILLVWIVVLQYIAAEKYQAVVKVVGESEEVSANVTTDGLDFGFLPRGNSSTRFVTIQNKGAHDVYVKIYKWGGITEFIEINRNGFVLKAGESENLEFSLKIPSGSEEKEYKGKIIVFEIPKFL